MLNEALLALIPMCAPDVAPNTIAQIIRVESRGDPLAINVNGLGKKVRAESQAEAARLTRYYINAGYSVDVGLMQVNSSNFAGLGYSHDRIEALFEPCANIAAGSQILKNFYLRHKGNKGEATALRAAISAYNTGSPTRGVANGYVGQVYGGKSPRRQAVVAENPQLSQAYRAPTAVDVSSISGSKRGQSPSQPE